MTRSRRSFLSSTLAGGLAAAVPLAGQGRKSAPTLPGTARYCAEGEEHYAALDAILKKPVLRREFFPDPVIIDTVELLHYQDSFLCRVRSKAGAEGIAIGNALQMRSLWSIFVERVAPYFPGKDARNLELLMEEVTVYESNYKLQSTAIWVPIATVEFAILDMLGKMANKSIGLLISDRIYNTDIAVYQANGERYITPEVTIEHIQKDLQESHAKAIKFKLGGRMSHAETPPGRSEQLIPMVRKVFGDDMVISADANGSYTVAEALPIARLMKEYKYAFFEEPVPFDWYEETLEVTKTSGMPVAGGEQEPSTHNFRWLIAHGALSITQQDMFYFGGMCRCMAVARMAAYMGKETIPHISSTGLGYLYMMHFVSAIPNAGKYHEFKEFNNTLPYQCATSTLRSVNGSIKVPTGPGLGVEIDPDYVKKHVVLKKLV